MSARLDTFARVVRVPSGVESVGSADSSSGARAFGEVPLGSPRPNSRSWISNRSCFLAFSDLGVSAENQVVVDLDV